MVLVTSIHPQAPRFGEYLFGVVGDEEKSPRSRLTRAATLGRALLQRPPSTVTLGFARCTWRSRPAATDGPSFRTPRHRTTQRYRNHGSASLGKTAATVTCRLSRSRAITTPTTWAVSPETVRAPGKPAPAASARATSEVPDLAPGRSISRAAAAPASGQRHQGRIDHAEHTFAREHETGAGEARDMSGSAKSRNASPNVTPRCHPRAFDGSRAKSPPRGSSRRRRWVLEISGSIRR